MRENLGLYRGKPTERFRDFLTLRKEFCDDGFVYGSLVVSCERYYICVFGICSSRSISNNGITTMVEVIPETVGQFTGLYDSTKWNSLTEAEQTEWLKDHTKSEWKGRKIFEEDIVRTDKFSEPAKQYIIKYDLQFSAFIGQDRYNCYFITFDGDSDEFEIIGNIHDNPEWIAGGEVT